MTDSPTRGHVHQPGARPWSTHTTPIRPSTRRPTRPDPPPRTACAERRRRQGPAAATRSALRPIPDPAAYFDAPTNRPRRSKTPRTRLTDPAPSGMTSAENAVVPRHRPSHLGGIWRGPSGGDAALRDENRSALTAAQEKAAITGSPAITSAGVTGRSSAGSPAWWVSSHRTGMSSLPLAAKSDQYMATGASRSVRRARPAGARRERLTYVLEARGSRATHFRHASSSSIPWSIGDC